jgi:hypothetical protein
MEAMGYDADGDFKFRHDRSWRRRLKGDDPKDIFYREAMSGAAREATDKKGEFDVLKWWNIIQRNPDLRSRYLASAEKTEHDWQQDGRYYGFWNRFTKLADGGRWDKAWETWDHAPDWLRDRYKEAKPKKFDEFVKSRKYSAYMGRWVSFFDRNDSRGAYRYFNSLPQWAKDRYYSNHPGKRLSQGQSSGYITMLNSLFARIDAGDWDGAESIWFSAPAYMRSQYYANNPSSTMFRGGGKSGWDPNKYKGGGSGYTRGSGGGGIPDAQFKQYTKMMGKWVGLLQDGKDDAADAYFKGLPKWAQNFYLQRNPDKKFLIESDKNLALLSEYLQSDKAEQRRMLESMPKFATWLNQYDSGAAFRNAVMWSYQNLPKDAWLRRVFREKYPDIFSKEAIGQKKIDDVFATLEGHPDLAPAWMRWYEDIVKTSIEAMKYMKPRPKEVTMDYSRMVGPRRGVSARELSELPGKAMRDRMARKREPRIS